jgi:hypothetical protein
LYAREEVLVKDVFAPGGNILMDKEAKENNTIERGGTIGV